MQLSGIDDKEMFMKFLNKIFHDLDYKLRNYEYVLAKILITSIN